jgi:hypothetical protein
MSRYARPEPGDKRYCGTAETRRVDGSLIPVVYSRPALLDGAFCVVVRLLGGRRSWERGLRPVRPYSRPHATSWGLCPQGLPPRTVAGRGGHRYGTAHPGPFGIIEVLPIPNGRWCLSRVCLLPPRPGASQGGPRAGGRFDEATAWMEFSCRNRARAASPRPEPRCLLALLGCFALAGYAAAQLVPSRPLAGAVWFLGAVVGHDLLLMPLTPSPTDPPWRRSGTARPACPRSRGSTTCGCPPGSLACFSYDSR